MGEGTNAVKSSGYFPACNVVVILKINQDAPEQKAVARLGKRIRTKRSTSKLEQGLNFTVNVDFWFCDDYICKKPEGRKNVIFVVSL